MRLYYSPGSSSLASHIALIEAGLPFETMRVDEHTKTMEGGGDYRRVHRLGYVPALLLDDGTLLTEGVAIMQHVAELARSRTLTPPAGTVERARLQAWLNFLSSEVHKAGFTPLFNPAMPEGAKRIFRDRLALRLSHLDRHLAKAFMKVTYEKKKILHDNAVTGQGLPTFGTQVLMNVINEVGGLPTRNHQDVQFESARDISAEAMATPRDTDGKAQLITNQACFGCTIACGRVSKMDKGHFTVSNKPQYWGASGGLEYEAAWALGAANGVKDLETLQYVTMLCNEEGIDPISFGATLGAVMELYEMGVLTSAQLGIEAPFGSAAALAFLAEETIYSRGFGKEIGQGSKRLTAKYGHPDLSMSTKGQEFPAYDGRAIQGIGLAYATSNRGGCHLRGYTIASEVLGIPVKTDPLEHEGKPELVKAFQDATAAFDSSGLCVFTTFAWGLADLAPQLQAACSDQFSTEELAKIGERIWNMEREFNNAAGFTKADDSLPKRLLTEAAKTGPAKGKVNMLAEMLPKYYAARGWDSEGVPTAETRERLSL